MTHAASAHSWYLLACVAGTVLLLLLLVVWLRLHAALGLCVAAFALGIASGMPIDRVPAAFASGVGSMMGHIAIILAMGALLGQLLASSGGATSLGRLLVEGCGPNGMIWALLLLGLLVGLPVFFEVGLVLLMPIVAEAAQRSRQPAILVGLPVMAGLSAMHGLVPPHPAALLACAVYHADVGRAILWGILVGAPAAVLAGPVLSWFLLRRWRRRGAKLEAQPAIGAASQTQSASSAALPPPAGAIRALAVILLPVALIFLGSWADALTRPATLPNRILLLIGSPDAAMIHAALVALALLGGRLQTAADPAPDRLRRLTAASFLPIAGVLVILSAAGGLSGVLRGSGAAQATVALALSAHLPPLVLAWALAALVRVSMGSATVAMAVASGVLAPIAGHLGVSPELLVMATGAGSLILSHVNDSGFWLVSSLFKTSVQETLASWSILETVLSVAGLAVTLLFSAVVH